MPRPFRMSGLTLLLAALAGASVAHAAEDADTKAARTEAQMTHAERMRLLLGVMPVAALPTQVEIPPDTPAMAGYVAGVPRLGVPAQWATDAGLGVTNPNQGRPGDVATAMPSGLALASAFDPDLAQRLGATVAQEARAKGFNILLGGGVNLTLDPRNGRNFEYLGEDPWLAGVLAGHAIRGTQGEGVASTIKHFALNAQETLRLYADAVMDEAALREGELLAFQLGIEIGQPASVMCAYNLVNGHKACGNDHLLNTVLKRDWGYKGWVMSDWGAVTDAGFINAGLDQQAGSQLDRQAWFGAPLQQLIDAGKVAPDRVSDAVRRILRSLYAVGIDTAYAPQPIDYAANARVALEAARAGIVLLKNDGALPLAASALEGKRVLVVGGSADFGVLAGGGSSQVTPSNGAPRVVGGRADDIMGMFTRQVFLPSSPLAALRAALPKAQISFQSGYSPEVGAAHAAKADLVLVFANKWEGEGQDSGSLALPQGQDALIAQLAAANPNTVVVLQTGNPITMPWLADVRAVVQAWYPGQEGGQAVADVLVGQVNPSGRLPMSFPHDLAQTPRGALPGLGLPPRTPVQVPYPEGSDAGYRWFARTGQAPLFAFGHGLGYTAFSHSQPWARQGDAVELGVSVRNDGARAGADVPQAYLVARNGQQLQRLVGFRKLTLEPGQQQQVSLRVDPRLLADYSAGGWTVPAGRYTFAFGKSASALGPTVELTLPAMRLKP
ncbi:glycoside hydrolase family 3 C-terminal domain-containing protein [Pseudorhodoferax sp. Leaf274]|uniref:beta-glucosidase n=1 Tax=Pseudorhodoferax sp. Leaf274 TaxID=1736318 RepID=UPI000702E8F5|nr:glycoside hydrolase family 3 C-terminal domain-containing protein [Pseudorhodoferax sp. Leaf274]KQP46236.1 beta-glucosidase [Pseudorhodoferax sp. Leaf274]